MNQGPLEDLDYRNQRVGESSLYILIYRQIQFELLNSNTTPKNMTSNYIMTPNYIMTSITTPLQVRAFTSYMSSLS